MTGRQRLYLLAEIVQFALAYGGPAACRRSERDRQLAISERQGDIRLGPQPLTLVTRVETLNIGIFTSHVLLRTDMARGIAVSVPQRAHQGSIHAEPRPPVGHTGGKPILDLRQSTGRGLQR